MPLMRGKSEKSFEHNVGTEIDSGKPRDQALAIAYSMKRKARKMARGGYMDEGGNVSGDSNSSQNSNSSKQNNSNSQSSSDSFPSIKNNRSLSSDAYTAFKNSSNQLASYAHGGEVENEDLDPEHSGSKEIEDELERFYHLSPHEESYGVTPEQREPYKPIYASEEDMPSHMMDHGGLTRMIMAKKMAEGGNVKSEERSDNYPDENSMSVKIARRIENPFYDVPELGGKRSEKYYPAAGDYGPGYAEGGTVDDEEDQDHDFLSDEEQDPYHHYNEFDEFKSPPRKRGLVGAVMESIRMRHMGR